MNALTRRAAVVVAAFGLLTASLPAQADALADNTATGTLTVNGTVTKVAYAYAWTAPGFFDKATEDVHVIVSDAPLDAKALGDPFARSKLADEGKLHSFEMIINSEGTPISTNWRHDGFKGPTPSGISNTDVFTAKVSDGKVIEASYKSAEPAEFFGNVSSFDVTFRAAIAK